MAFWSLIGKPLVDCINYSYEFGELSNSQKQAIITLIEKKGKDKRVIKNWRPISLINVDAKIILYFSNEDGYHISRQNDAGSRKRTT